MSRWTSGKKLLAEQPEARASLLLTTGGLECVILIDGRLFA
jgi:hypothetical protein